MRLGMENLVSLLMMIRYNIEVGSELLIIETSGMTVDLCFLVIPLSSFSMLLQLVSNSNQRNI